MPVFRAGMGRGRKSRRQRKGRPGLLVEDGAAGGAARSGRFPDFFCGRKGENNLPCSGGGQKAEPCGHEKAKSAARARNPRRLPAPGNHGRRFSLPLMSSRARSRSSGVFIFKKAVSSGQGTRLLPHEGRAEWMPKRPSCRAASSASCVNSPAAKTSRRAAYRPSSAAFRLPVRSPGTAQRHRTEIPPPAGKIPAACRRSDPAGPPEACANDHPFSLKTSRNSSPYFSSFASPTPDTFNISWSVAG